MSPEEQQSAENDVPECGRCEGTGDRFGRAYGSKVSCPDCKGTGDVAPEAGPIVARDGWLFTPAEQPAVSDPRFARVEAVLDACESRLQRSPDRVLGFWVREVRAALSPAENAPQSQGLGRMVADLLDDHWPDHAVNGWYLADLLRERGVYVIPPAKGDGGAA